jgi:hypothetical protein
LDADIVYNLNPRMKEAFGKVAYWIGGFSKVGRRIPEFTVQANGREYRASFALLSRVRNYGGDLEIAPTISLLDDEFEMVLFEGESSFGFLEVHAGGSGSPAADHARHHDFANAPGGISRARGFEDPCAGGRRVCGLGARACRNCSQCAHALVPPGFRARRPASVPTSVDDAAWTTSPTR